MHQYAVITFGNNFKCNLGRGLAVNFRMKCGAKRNSFHRIFLKFFCGECGEPRLIFFHRIHRIHRISYINLPQKKCKKMNAKIFYKNSPKNLDPGS